MDDVYGGRTRTDADGCELAGRARDDDGRGRMRMGSARKTTHIGDHSFMGPHVSQCPAAASVPPPCAASIVPSPCLSLRRATPCSVASKTNTGGAARRPGLVSGPIPLLSGRAAAVPFGT